jgi:hypothetical protein
MAQITIKGVTYEIDPLVSDVEECAKETGVNFFAAINMMALDSQTMFEAVTYMMKPRPTVETVRTFRYREFLKVIQLATKEMGGEDAVEGSEPARPSDGPSSGLVQ